MGIGSLINSNLLAILILIIFFRCSQIVGGVLFVFVLVVAIVGLSKMESEDIQCFGKQFAFFMATKW